MRVDKKCPKCSKRKPTEDFCKNKARWDGLDSYCRECKSEYRKQGGYNLRKNRSSNKVTKRTESCTLHRTVVLPDMHVPEHDEECVNAVLEFIKYYKPHRIIQLGDFCDFDSLSRHDYSCPEDIKNLDYELSESEKMLDRIDSVLPPNCEKYMIGGNHEDRWHKVRVTHKDLPKKIKTTMKQLAVSWGTELRLTQRGWNWCEYTGRSFDPTSHPQDHFKLGKIVYTHGKFTGQTCAKRMADQFPGDNVVFGHTHGRYIHGSIDSERLPIESESIGTLSKFDLTYLRGKRPTNWVHGFAHIYTRKSGLFQKVFTHILNGKFIVNGRKYGGSGIELMPDERANR